MSYLLLGKLSILFGSCNHIGFFKKYFIYLFNFRERGREGEREGEKLQCVVASYMAPTEDLARNPGMCPDWELNQQHFGSQPVLNPLSYTSQGITLDLNSLVWHVEVMAFSSSSR